MPIYEYQCGKCGHEFERQQRMSDDPVKTCPECRSRKVKKLISQTSFVLKGGGWYSDLYSSSKDGKSGDSDSANASNSETSSKSEDSSKSETEKKPETKSKGKKDGSKGGSKKSGKKSAA